MKKHLIPNRVDIDLRPIEADMRLEFEHFKTDTIEMPVLANTVMML